MITNSRPAFHENGPVRYRLRASSTVFALCRRCSARPPGTARGVLATALMPLGDADVGVVIGVVLWEEADGDRDGLVERKRALLLLCGCGACLGARRRDRRTDRDELIGRDMAGGVGLDNALREGCYRLCKLLRYGIGCVWECVWGVYRPRLATGQLCIIS